MRPAEKKMITTFIFSILTIMAALALFYILDLDLIKSQAVLSLVYYGITLVSFMALVSLFSFIYQFVRIKGKQPPGFYSSVFYKHLTQEQLNNLSQTNQGKKDAFYHEFLVMRLDIIFPASIIFILFIMNAVPAISGNVVSYLVMGEMLGIFALSYVIYSQMQASLIAIKLSGAFPQEQIMKIEDVIQLAAMEI